MDIKTMNKQKLHNTKIFCVFFLLCFVFIVTTSCNKQDNKNTAKETDNGNNYVSSTKTKGEKKLVEVVDLAGRTVTVPTGNVKIFLEKSRMIYFLAPLFGKNGNPFTHIIGWNNFLKKYDPDTYELYVEKFPEIPTITHLGNLYKGDISIEKIIELNPDILILNLYSLANAKEIGLIKKLEKVGIKTVFVNFRESATQQHTVPSMLLLGQIFQKQNEASKFLNFYFSQMQKVTSVVNELKENEKPLVFLEYSANMRREKVKEHITSGPVYMGHFIKIAGGKNYGSKLLGSHKISTEKLFAIDPDVIIGTGANWSHWISDTGAVLLGYKATKKDSQERLQAIASRTGWKTLKAVKNKRLYNIWHHFTNSPHHFIAIQQIAKWLHPDKFADLNPEKTFKEFHDKFLPIDYSGIFWTSLE